MKKPTFKLITAILFLSIGLQSCSSDTEETLDLSALDQELALDNNGFLEIESTTYVFKNSGETVRFNNEERAYDFVFTNGINYKASGGISKHAGEELVITNPETDEFIRFYHFEEVKKGLLKFDVELSTGKIYKSVTYKFGEAFTTQDQKCHEWPCVSISANVLGSMIEMSANTLSADCQNAVDACTRAGGKSSVTIQKEVLWFASARTCNVQCNY
ncbi:hypothetical protein FK178_02385 [Antarcticibacterium arcticum]|uniref:Lipoprotein n=1 Tax=Antarcticibacterium arcticum TaxID=2585771 RepID=A0A5B8YFC2_9FLAO|nr:hypothetical protein [Antarcticibacterium arcticum]QED36630.1 hypothetical protein FK178_02385 [Antarcticibacterium arcticum]